MSRSAFFERFRLAIGCCTPIEYATALRMAVARDLLQHGDLTVAETAYRVGYGSASAFAVAFLRQEGLPPGLFAKRSAAQQGGQVE